MFESRFSNSEVEAIDKAFNLLYTLNSAADENGSTNWALQGDPTNPYALVYKAIRAMIETHYGPQTVDLFMNYWADNFEGFRYNENLVAERLLQRALGY